MTPARFRWGVILVQVGILLLLRNLDILNDNFWGEFLIYFPVVLIAIGIEKIFTKSRLQFISYLTSMALFFGGFAIAFSSSRGGFEGSFFSQTTYREDYSPMIKKLKAVLRLDHTDLTIRDSGSDLVFGRFNKFTRKPKINYDLDGGLARVYFIGRSGSFLGGAIKISTGEPQDWYIRFSDKVPLDFECSGEDSDIHLNLSTTPLERLKLEVDDAYIYLKLGTLEPLVNVSIIGEDSQLRLRVPENVGLKISGQDYHSYLEKIGLIDAGGGSFVSEGFDTMSAVIEIDLDDRLNSFILEYF